MCREGAKPRLSTERDTAEATDVKLLTQRIGEHVWWTIVEMIDFIRADRLCKQSVLRGHTTRLQGFHHTVEDLTTIEGSREMPLHSLHRRLEFCIRLEEAFI